MKGWAEFVGHGGLPHSHGRCGVKAVCDGLVAQTEVVELSGAVPSSERPTIYSLGWTDTWVHVVGLVKAGEVGWRGSTLKASVVQGSVQELALTAGIQYVFQHDGISSLTAHEAGCKHVWGAARGGSGGAAGWVQRRGIEVQSRLVAGCLHARVLASKQLPRAHGRAPLTAQHGEAQLHDEHQVAAHEQKVCRGAGRRKEARSLSTTLHKRPPRAQALHGPHEPHPCPAPRLGRWLPWSSGGSGRRGRTWWHPQTGRCPQGRHYPCRKPPRMAHRTAPRAGRLAGHCKAPSLRSAGRKMVGQEANCCAGLVAELMGPDKTLCRRSAGR